MVPVNFWFRGLLIPENGHLNQKRLWERPQRPTTSMTGPWNSLLSPKLWPCILRKRTHTHFNLYNSRFSGMVCMHMGYKFSFFLSQYTLRSGCGWASEASLGSLERGWSFLFLPVESRPLYNAHSLSYWHNTNLPTEFWRLRLMQCGGLGMPSLKYFY